MRRIATPALVIAVLAVVIPAVVSAKKQKPVKTAASVSISSRVVSDSDPVYTLFSFSGKVSSKAACRSDRSVLVSVSTDGGPAVPDARKGGFASKSGEWVSVYDLLFTKGHTYAVTALVKPVSARQGGKRFACKGDSSPTVTVSP
jgi:hypothetical protein